MGKQIPASDVSNEILRFLEDLNSTKHSGREKALKSFLKLMKTQGDEIYDDDVDIALLGKNDMHGLLAWSGEKNKKHGLKRTSGLAMWTLHYLVTCNEGGLQDQNLWLSRLRCVSIENLKCLSLEHHILSETRKRGLLSGDRGAMHEACVITQLLLDSHFNPETKEPEDLTLEDLVHSKEAQDLFTDEISSWMLMNENSSSQKGIDFHQHPLRTSEGTAPSLVAARGISEEDCMSLGTVKVTNSHPLSLGSERDVHSCDNSMLMSDGGSQTELQHQFPTVQAAKPLLQFLDGLKATEIEADKVKSQRTLHMKDPLALNGGSFHLADFQGIRGTGLVATGKEDNLPYPPAGNVDDLNIANTGKEASQKIYPTPKKNLFRYLQPKQIHHGFFTKSISPFSKDSSVTTSPAKKLFRAFEEMPAEQREQVNLECITLTEETFQPELFMTIMHPDDGLDDLRNKLENLQKAKDEQVNQLHLLVKNNFNKFVRCSACIETYADRIDKELCSASCAEGAMVIPANDSSQTPHANELKEPETVDKDSGINAASSHLYLSTLFSKGGNQTKSANANSLVCDLLSLLHSAQSEASSEFSELLGKLDEMEEARAAQSLLQNKRELLDVPTKMQACLERKKYKELVKLYNFAYETSSGPIELKVRQEADIVAQAAHIQLLSTLESPNASIDDQIVAVDVLSMLGYSDGDPSLPLCICLDDQIEHFTQIVNAIRDYYGEKLENAYNNSSNLASGIDRLVNIKFQPPKGGGAAAVDAGGTDRLKSTLYMSETNLGHTSRSSSGSSANLSTIINPNTDLNNIFKSDTRYNPLPIGQPFTSTAPPPPWGTVGSHASSELQDDTGSSVHLYSTARLKHIQNICECLSSWVPYLAELSCHLISYELMSVVAKSESGGSMGIDLSPSQISVDETVKTLAKIREKDPTRGNTIGGTNCGSSVEQRPCGGSLPLGTKAPTSGLVLTLSKHQKSLIFNECLSSSAHDIFTTVLGTGVGFVLGGENAGIFSPEEYVPSPIIRHMIDHASTSKVFAESFLSCPLGPAYMRPVLQSLAGLTCALKKCMNSVPETSLLLENGTSDLSAAVLKIQEAYINYMSEAMRVDACTLKCDREEKPLSGNMSAHPFDLKHSRKFETTITQELKDLAALLPHPEASAEQVSIAISHALHGMLDEFVKLISETCISHGVEKDIGSNTAAFSLSTQLQDEMDHDQVLFHCLAECLYMEQEGMPKLRSLIKELFGPTVALEDIAAEDEKVFTKNMDTILKHYIKDLKQLVSKYVKEAWWVHPRISISTTASVPATATATEEKSVSITASGDRAAVVTIPPPYLVKALLILVNTRWKASKHLGKWLLQTRHTSVTMGSGDLTEGNQYQQTSYSVLYSDYLMRESVRLIMNIVCNCANQCTMTESKDEGITPLSGTDLVDIASRIAQIEFLRETLWRYIPSETMERTSRSIHRLYNTIRDASCDDHLNTTSNTIQNGGGGSQGLRSLKLKPPITKKMTESKRSKVSDMVAQLLSPGELANLLTVSKLQNALRLHVCALR